jgi:hypothetical protein
MIKLSYKKARRPTIKEIEKRETLGRYFVWWDKVPRKLYVEYSKALSLAKHEREMQKFLQDNRMLLTQLVGGGHGRWVIPNFKFGSEYVADFILGEKHSFGYDWALVELEGPKNKPFTKAGNPSARLSHAIKQIQEWRSWISSNISYCQLSESNNGLGLVDIRSESRGLIIIGRRGDFSGHERIRRQMSIDSNIAIHSYDHLLNNGVGGDILAAQLRY